MNISSHQKDIIENNPVFIGTSDIDNNPNITIVDGVRINKVGQIVIVDVQMKTCKKNLENNPKCCLSVYSSESKLGCKIFGTAEYKTSGKDFDNAIERQKESEFKPKGVFLIAPRTIINIE